MKRPVIPIPAGAPPLCYVARDFESFIAEQLRAHPELELPRLLGYLVTMATGGIVSAIGIEAAARFVFETMQDVQFLETIEGCHRTPDGTLYFDCMPDPPDDEPTN